MGENGQDRCIFFQKRKVRNDIDVTIIEHIPDLNWFNTSFGMGHGVVLLAMNNVASYLNCAIFIPHTHGRLIGHGLGTPLPRQDGLWAIFKKIDKKRIPHTRVWFWYTKM